MASSYEVDSTSDCVVSSLGCYSLKSEQKAVIKEFVMGKDVFAIFPTGYGKSLCYACLPGVFDKIFGSTLSIVAVITPLTSIMKDHAGTMVETMHGYIIYVINKQ